MANKEEKEDDSRYEFNSVKFAHELMVDVLGALIPGALFLFCIILCIVFPIICYSTQKNNFGFLMKDGDWFWIVAFLSFLILSYVLGLIFYRADIKIPDRVDIRREQKKKLLSFIDRMPTGIGRKNSEDNFSFKSLRVRYAANLLLSEVSPLAKALEECKEKGLCNTPYNTTYLDCCKNVEKFLKELIRTPKRVSNSHDVYSADFRENILCVLFPEAINHINSHDNIENPTEDTSETKPSFGSRHIYVWIAKKIFPELSRLPLKSRSVIVDAVKIVPLVHDFRFKAKWMAAKMFLFKKRLNKVNNGSWIERVIIGDIKKFEPYNLLMVAYLILHMQNESGCATEKRCDFPYMSYYKYLLKRRLFNLLKYADWTTSSARTKNHINKYKIDLQLHVPNAYAVIIKNESHIRMASSSWHVARVIRNLSWVVLIFTFLVCVSGIEYNVRSKDDGLKKEQNEKQDGLKFVVNYQEGESHTFSMGEQKGLVNVTTDSKDNYNSVKSERTEETSKTVKHTTSEQSAGNGSNDATSDNPKKDTYVKFIDTVLPFIGYTKIANIYLAILFPLLTLLLSYSILKKIPQFIHYQRLREVYFTLELYMRWEEAKEKRDEKDLHDLNIRRASVNLPPISSIESAKNFYH